MKKTLANIGLSFLGAVIALGLYTTFIHKEHIKTTKDIDQSNIINANYNRNINTIDSQISFVETAKKSINCVVHVKNTSLVRRNDPYSYYGYRTYKQVGEGSGVIISSDGYIVTNYHVIRNTRDIEITLNNQKVYKAEIVGFYEDIDIALLKIDDNDLEYMEFGDSDKTNIGEWVLAVGNPYNLNSTVTAGIISAKGRNLSNNQNIESFIQTDAAVNPGNSGGALVDVSGKLIGINTKISSETGSYIGYSFAVPSNIVKKIIEDIMDNGYVERAYMGISGGELDFELSKRLNIELTQGYFVNRVSPSGGAEKAGVKRGDIILKLDENKISTSADLIGYLNSKKPNDIIKTTVYRGGKEIILNVKLNALNK
ncbi:MAG: trypsin-like peptidase domain-containing protein [Flavobacteriaceae bacterium]|nr:trypsin-like peptidase domain-containing protein [Flavobacteriaceae bacterium]